MKYLLLCIALLFSHASFAADISVSHAWSRTSFGETKVGVAYLTINNPTDHNVTLESASGDIAKTIEIHTHMHDNGVMKMRKLDKLDIDPRSDAVFKPGGLHFMLFDLAHPLESGESFPMTLHFASGEKIVTTVTVK